MADSAAGRGVFPELRRALPSQLPAYLAAQRWFGGKARTIRAAELVDVIPIAIPAAGSNPAQDAYLLIVAVAYADGANESYAIPVLRSESVTGAAASASAGLALEASDNRAAVVLVDALKDEAFLAALLQLIDRQATVAGEKGELRASQTTAYARTLQAPSNSLRPKPIDGEQSNTSIIYGDKFILKFFRRVEEGINPDLEIGVFLTEKAHFVHTPQVTGSLQYHTRDGKDSAQGILQAFVPNRGNAWVYTMGELAMFYGAVPKHVAGGSAQAASGQEEAAIVRDAAGPYLQSAALLGERTAQMHLALACDSQDRSFSPEPFTTEFQRELEQSMRALSGRVFSQLREKLASLPGEWREKGGQVAAAEKEIGRRFQAVLSQPIRATRTRIHGDYHLGQVLYTGSDFVIIDFEGEPARALAERRIKRSPLQDVAGMLRSFHYAAFAPLLTAKDGHAAGARNLEKFGAWAEAWNAAVVDRFLASYFEGAGAASYLPESHEETKVLLELHLLEKAVYELGYELNNRPSWVGIPLQGISRLLLDQV